MPQVPDNPILSAPTQLPQLDASAQTIGQAAQQVAGSIKGVGDEAGRLALKLQEEDDKATLADQRILIREEEAKLNEWIIKNAKHPSVWIEEANRRMRGVMDGVISGRLLQEGKKITPALRREMEAQGKMLTSSVIRRAGDKAAMSMARNAKAKRDYEWQQFGEERNWEAQEAMEDLPEVSEEEALDMRSRREGMMREAEVSDTLVPDIPSKIAEVNGNDSYSVDEKRAITTQLQKRHQKAQTDAISQVNDFMTASDSEGNPITRQDYEKMLEQTGAFTKEDGSQDTALIKRISANNFLGSVTTPLSTTETAQIRDAIATIRGTYIKNNYQLSRQQRAKIVDAWDSLYNRLHVEGKRAGGLMDELEQVHPDTLDREARQVAEKSIADQRKQQMGEYDWEAKVDHDAAMERWSLTTGRNFVPLPNIDPAAAKRSDADNLKIAKELGVAPEEVKDRDFDGWSMEGKEARKIHERTLRKQEAQRRAEFQRLLQQGFTPKEAMQQIRTGVQSSQELDEISGRTPASWTPGNTESTNLNFPLPPSGDESILSEEEWMQLYSEANPLLPSPRNPLGGAPP